MQKAIITLLLLGGLLLAPAVSAQGLPASFDHPEKSLESLIEFPELRGDAKRRLRCAARVKKNGKLEDHGCYLVAAGDEVFVQALNAAARKARMRPARIDGEATEIYLQYQAEFVRKGEDQSVTLFNHPGLTENIEAYGDNHVAAQRELTDETWQKICPRRTRFTVWAKAHVAEDGTASHFSLTAGDGPAVTEKCGNAILATMAESRYTAARADGEAVPSTFIEPFGN